MADVDLSQLRDLAQDMGRVPGYADRLIEPVVKEAAEDVRKLLIEGARWSPHFKGLARSITAEAKPPAIGSIAYVIGPDKARRGGALGNIFYFGTSRGGGSGDLAGALNTAAPAFRRNLERASAIMARLGVGVGG
jgi:hypothetical protein